MGTLTKTYLFFKAKASLDIMPEAVKITKKVTWDDYCGLLVKLGSKFTGFHLAEENGRLHQNLRDLESYLRDSAVVT